MVFLSKRYFLSGDGDDDDDDDESLSLRSYLFQDST
jgi:hypothetical protein